LAAAVAGAATLVGPLSGTSHAATPDTARNDAWNAYGNGGAGDAWARWNGGDGTIGTRLPDGRVAYTFSDTWRGPVNSQGIRPVFQNNMVNNSMVVASSTAASASLATVPAAPSNDDGWNSKSLVQGPLIEGAVKLWTGDGIIHNGKLVKLYMGFSAVSGCDVFGRPVSTVVATFDLPSGGLPRLASTQALATPKDITWGTALINSGGYTYIYGAQDLRGPDCSFHGRRLHIARVPTGQFGAAWEHVASRDMPAGLFTEFSVAKIGTAFHLITQDYDHNVLDYASTTPTGFGGTPTTLFTIPAHGPWSRYAARMQPALTTSTEIVVSYNVNTDRESQDACASEHYFNASIYRPRFMRVPRSALATPSAAAVRTPAPPPPVTASQPVRIDRARLSAAPARLRAGDARALAAAQPGVAAAFPLDEIVWVGPGRCTRQVGAPTNLTGHSHTDAQGLKARVYWDFKGPTVWSIAWRQRPGQPDYDPLPMMLVGSSPNPSVIDEGGPDVVRLPGTPPRIRWTDSPVSPGGSYVKYKVCTHSWVGGEECRIIDVLL
ncbi:MAG TPA: hypothetical protein VHJ17_00070, partial [Thermomonospora sp.]|nr:hypothetical protein [Thermomonospora sp.]